MTWEHHLGLGFFGFNGGTGMRWVVREGLESAFETVRDDLSHAFDEVQDVIDAFFRTLNFPESPAFTGGVLDAWPARMVDGLGIARREWQAVQSHHAYLERERQKREAEAKRHG